MNKVRLATVFSGIGAIEFALKRLGIETEIVFACDNGERDIEYDKEKEFTNIRALKSFEEKKKYVDELYNSKTRKHNFVKDAYFANYEIDENRWFEDICLLDGTDFTNQVDLLVGGSPCQSFSSVGFQKGLDDTRGTLFYEYARLIKEVQPKVFIYENVRNMINHDKGNTWTIIKGIFDSLGYNIDYKILNAVDFGIPQKRSRLFVVGYKKDFGITPSIPEKKENKKNYTMQDFLISNCAFGDFNYDENGELVINKSNGIVGERYFLSKAVEIYVLKDGTKDWHQKPEINLPVARTLLKTMGNCHRAGVDNYVTEHEKIRMLTEREALRLMGYTDDFRIVTSIPQAYKQAGNSIVVDVMMKIVNMMFNQNVLGGKDKICH